MSPSGRTPARLRPGRGLLRTREGNGEAPPRARRPWERLLAAREVACHFSHFFLHNTAQQPLGRRGRMSLRALGGAQGHTGFALEIAWLLV